jgi:hypothetical protein
LPSQTGDGNEWKEPRAMQYEIRAALIADHQRRCPCGAVAERQGSLCRKCQARLTWRRKYDATSRRAARRLARRQARDGARLLAGVLALLGTEDKGAES